LSKEGTAAHQGNYQRQTGESGVLHKQVFASRKSRAWDYIILESATDEESSYAVVNGLKAALWCCFTIFLVQIRSVVEKGGHERTSNKGTQKYHKNQHLKVKVHPT
jgi:hypothetical protein